MAPGKPAPARVLPCLAVCADTVLGLARIDSLVFSLQVNTPGDRQLLRHAATKSLREGAIVRAEFSALRC